MISRVSEVIDTIVLNFLTVGLATLLAQRIAYTIFLNFLLVFLDDDSLLVVYSY